jgi:hypothetical protein
MPQNQLAPAGKARFHGVYEGGASIAYNGRSATARTLTLLETANVEPMADKAEAKDSDGEMQNIKYRNDRVQFSFSAAPIGAAASDAEAIAEDLPKIGTLATITCAGNAQIATPAGGTTVIDSASAKFSPEGHAVIDMTVTHWIGKVFTAIAS